MLMAATRLDIRDALQECRACLSDAVIHPYQNAERDMLRLLIHRQPLHSWAVGASDPRMLPITISERKTGTP
jgi:hypothetical protein